MISYRVVNKFEHIRINSYMQKASPYTAKITKSKIAQLRFIQLPQSPFFPDVSPNDFILYGMLKDRFKGRSHETFDDFLDSIDEILSEINKEVWEAFYGFGDLIK